VLNHVVIVVKLCCVEDLIEDRCTFLIWASQQRVLLIVTPRSFSTDV